MGRPRLSPGEQGQPWTVPLKDGGHRAVVRVRDRDGRVREVTATRDTKGAALRALQRKLETRMPPSGTGIKATMSLDELGQAWLRHREQHGHARRRTPLRPQTLAAYADQHRLVIGPALGGVRLGEASVGLIETVLADLEAAGISTAGARSVLNQMFALALRHGAISANPMPLVAKPPRDAREVEALDLTAARLLRAAVDPVSRRQPGKRGPNPDLAHLVDVALGTGARIGEILALTWGHLDLASELPTAHICGTLVEPRRAYVAGLHRQDSTKSHTERTLVLPDHVVTLLAQRQQLSRYDAAGDPVFASRAGTWLWPNNLRTRLRAAVADNPLLVGTTPHTLRRTVGTRIAHEAGLDAAREQLGHSDPSITWRTYVARRPVAPDLRHVLNDFFSPADNL